MSSQLGSGESSLFIYFPEIVRGCGVSRSMSRLEIPLIFCVLRFWLIHTFPSEVCRIPKGDTVDQSGAGTIGSFLG